MPLPKPFRIVVKTSLLLLLLVASVAGEPEGVSAAVLNVPGDFASMQAAIDAAAPGDTILVEPGVYVGSLRFNGKDVSIQSTGGPEVTTVDGNGDSAVEIGPGGELVGFTVTGGAASFGAGMEVHGTGTLVKGNIFDGNSQGAGGSGAGIYGNVSSPTIENNVFRNNTCDNQFVSGVVVFANASSPRIVNNIFEDNPCRAVNMTLPSGNNPQVINNTMVRNRVGVRVDRRVQSVAQRYRNNILAENEIGLEVDFGTDAFNPTWTNNLLFNNGIDYEVVSSQTGLAGNIAGDPLFVDSVGGDYHLQAGSPAIDAGTYMEAPDLDYEGDLRPADGDHNNKLADDMGVDEFVNGSLSGVYDALVHPADKSVGLHHCIVRLDHDASDDQIEGAAVCYVDTPGLNPGSDLPEPADMLPGKPPPPPYTTSAPAKLDGSYDSGTDTLTLAGCWANIGGSLGPNAILEITVPNAQASLPDLQGSVLIYERQSVAGCEAAKPAGTPDSDSVNLTRVAPDRDFDSDGCPDFVELAQPVPPNACGDDPYNPYDWDDNVEAVGNLLVTVQRADVCQGGFSTQTPDPCAGPNGTPDDGTGDDLADGTVVGGSYYHCITDTNGPNAGLAVRIFCYTDNSVTTVNCENAARVAGSSCSLASSTCDPVIAGAQDPSLCGDGLPGDPPPLSLGDVDGSHTQLSGTYDKGTNQLSISGCFQQVENALEGPSIYWDLSVNGQTGQGTVDIWTQQTEADCKSDNPQGPPTFDDALIETVEQAPKGADYDTDGDNCSDQTELGASSGIGGQRDPYNRWDFMDQWTNGQMDGAVAIADIGAVLARFGSTGTPGDPKDPPSSQFGYHSQADRSGSLIGSNAWNLGPPDGTIGLNDIGAVVARFGDAGCGSKSP